MQTAPDEREDWAAAASGATGGGMRALATCADAGMAPVGHHTPGGTAEACGSLPANPVAVERLLVLIACSPTSTREASVS